MNIGFEGPRAIARTLIKEGETRFCALAWNGAAAPRTTEDAYKRLVWTAHHWQHWLARGTFPDHPWRSHLERSALTLKGLTYAPSGAVVAAPTTSLPETPGGERNWDYRYSWIRDSTFALWGLYTLGFDWEADDYLAFIADVAERDDELQIMYGIDGERALDEQVLAHLSGYEGASPVRIGNAAYGQRQHDMWGAVLDSVYLHTKSRDHLDERIWPILVRQVEAALANWREPDRGIWEVRGEPKHFTSSKVMCWVAADRGARLARLRGDEALAARWQAAADEIHADICANGVDERGVFTQHYETDALDASVLLMPLVRFLPADDERIRRTVLAIADELTDDGLVLRYRTEETDDGLSGREGTFTICSFWLVSALCEIGEDATALDGCARSCSRTPAPRPVRRGARSRHRTAPRQLPAGLHPPVAHQRGDARHPRRARRNRRRRPPLADRAGDLGVRQRQARSGDEAHATTEEGRPRTVARRARHNGSVKPFRFLAEARAIASGRELAETARRAEAIGIDTLVIPDHLIPQSAPVPAMATIAAATDRLRVAGFVLNNDLRHPAVLAQDLARLDVLSDGRLDVAIGAGWNRPEYEAIGLPFDRTPVRQARLAEAIAVLKGCFADGAFSFAGEHYTITDYDAHPKPVQRPHPPFLIGGGGRRTLTLAAREAQIVGLAPRILPNGKRRPRIGDRRRHGARRSPGCARRPATASTSWSSTSTRR